MISTLAAAGLVTVAGIHGEAGAGRADTSNPQPQPHLFTDEHLLNPAPRSRKANRDDFPDPRPRRMRQTSCIYVLCTLCICRLLLPASPLHRTARAVRLIWHRWRPERATGVSACPRMVSIGTTWNEDAPSVAATCPARLCSAAGFSRNAVSTAPCRYPL